MNRSTHLTVGMALSEAWRAQLQTMQACESAVIAGGDVEALHDFRVALRTTRALLRLFRRYLPAAQSLAQELAWLSAALNRARDLDIVAQFLQRTADHSLAGEQRALTTCRRELGRERAAQQKALQTLLRGRRCRRLVRAWESYIDRCAHAEVMPPTLHISLATAQRVIALKQMIRLLRRREQESSAIELHRLRIRCKRLRYLLEVLPPAADKKGAALLPVLTRLQRVLGDYQDAVVIRAWLAQRAGAVPAAWSAAAERQQQAALAELTVAWQAFVAACRV